MVKRAGGALLLSIRIEHGSSRPVSTQLHTGLRDLIWRLRPWPASASQPHAGA